MSRQTITLTHQNNEWLKEQVAKEDFTSKSEVINCLIEQARDRDAYCGFVQMKIDRGVESGIVEKQSKEELLEEFKKRIKNVY
ncbi:CopG family transcriptional regulator [Flavobacterium sp. SUN046]|uniref:ribbon-helix-helix domain-containing protein n=1 Tax=Flavobacterium sp. SUN046 TaxID=3002440 RepID=UPI002DB9D149|nr:CopG family transcriptional regulator [Flavobacterium sp. SUN046]MEC4050534.1 CopG family transcriptional regulator [Flavobacterium sp. SUN046]